MSLALDSMAGNCLVGYADLQLEGSCMGRIAYAGSSGSIADALALLAEEAKVFIDEWQARTAALEVKVIEERRSRSSSISRSSPPCTGMDVLQTLVLESNAKGKRRLWFGQVNDLPVTTCPADL